MPFETPLRLLYDRQIDCHTLPADIFTEPEHYPVTLGKTLEVNGQHYAALVIPACSVLPEDAVPGLERLQAEGFPLIFVDRLPRTLSRTGAPLPASLQGCRCVPLERLPEEVEKLGFPFPRPEPAAPLLRFLHIQGDTDLFMVVNEAAETYRGRVQLSAQGDCFLYDPWHNRCLPARMEEGKVCLELRPLESIFIVFGQAPALTVLPEYAGHPVELTTWERSLCPGIAYPAFTGKKPVTLPDRLAAEQPEFSGFVRYETVFPGTDGQTVLLEIDDAAEGVEVFLNGTSLGIQIVPPFRYDLSGLIRTGENRLAIEVATTLERQCYPMLKGYRKLLASKPTCESGLTGKVRLYLP